MPNPLPDFENRSVRKAKFKITSVGDGLSTALSVGPKAWHAGDEVVLVVKAVIAEVNHKTEKDTEDLIRVHTAKGVEVYEVDASSVQKLLDNSREELAVKVQAAKDAEAGQTDLLDKAAAAAEAEDMSPAARDELAKGSLHIEADE